MYVWYGPMKDAGFYLHRPSVILYSAPFTSPCGEITTEMAFMCTADQQVYFSREILRTRSSYLELSRFYPEQIIGHEFGHILQHRIMILGSTFALTTRAKDNGDPDPMDSNRRMEMQATCFGGLSLQAIGKAIGLTSQDLDDISGYWNVTYSEQHGKGENHAYWSSIGSDSSSVAACNTFVAGPEHTG
jgi:predicted metalloprotease